MQFTVVKKFMYADMFSAKETHAARGDRMVAMNLGLQPCNEAGEVADSAPVLAGKFVEGLYNEGFLARIDEAPVAQKAPKSPPTPPVSPETPEKSPPAAVTPEKGEAPAEDPTAVSGPSPEAGAPVKPE